MTDNARAYVYLHRKATDGIVFYIGKGNNRKNRKTKYERAYTKSKRNMYWQNIVNKHGYTVEIIVENINDEEAQQIEKELIKQYGRNNLCNLTDGGDGHTGYICSDSLREIRRKNASGENHPNFGKKLSAEILYKKSEAIKGDKHHLFGKKLSKDWVENIRQAKIGAKNPAFGKPSLRRKKVINIETGIIYNSLMEASEILGYKFKTLSNMLNGHRKNSTILRYQNGM